MTTFNSGDTSEVAELGEIMDMLKQAEEVSLQVEVVWSFGNERASGHDVAQACVNALYEWDI